MKIFRRKLLLKKLIRDIMFFWSLILGQKEIFMEIILMMIDPYFFWIMNAFFFA